MKIKFDKYYNGEWKYDLSLGVGLSFSGVPNDYKIFLDIMQGASCNPVSARRILNVLESGEVKYVTVMSRLDFNQIGDELKMVGVEMQITSPYNYKDSNEILNNSMVDEEVLSLLLNNKSIYKDLEGDLKLLSKERLLEFKESVKNRPHNFGLYER